MNDPVGALSAFAELTRAVGGQPIFVTQAEFDRWKADEEAVLGSTPIGERASGLHSSATRWACGCLSRHADGSSADGPPTSSCRLTGCSGRPRKAAPLAVRDSTRSTIRSMTR